MSTPATHQCVQFALAGRLGQPADVDVVEDVEVRVVDERRAAEELSDVLELLSVPRELLRLPSQLLAAVACEPRAHALQKV